MSKDISTTLTDAEAEAFMEEGLRDSLGAELSPPLASAYKKIRTAIVRAVGRPDEADELCQCGTPVDICKRYPCEVQP